LSETSRYYAAASSSFGDEFRGACRDLVGSFKDTRIWFALGLNDVVARYRGSILGPFWITLTTAVFVLGIGFLYAGLMKVSLDRYLPWMTTGLVVWNLISQTVLEGADAFVAASDVLRQAALPAPLFVWRVIWRNVLTFVHQLPVLIIVGLKFGYLAHVHLAEAIIGFVLVVANVSWFALAFAAICARFRDLKQILASLFQLLFFLSPVLWIPSEMRGLGGRLLALNPIVQMLDVLRGPLIADEFHLHSVLYLLAMGVAGWAFTLVLLAKVRRRIVHYV
jgi:ABC-type polysaccharide/polyol phosphate export permease